MASLMPSGKHQSGALKPSKLGRQSMLEPLGTRTLYNSQSVTIRALWARYTSRPTAVYLPLGSKAVDPCHMKAWRRFYVPSSLSCQTQIQYPKSAFALQEVTFEDLCKYTMTVDIGHNPMKMVK